MLRRGRIGHLSTRSGRTMTQVRIYQRGLADGGTDDVVPALTAIASASERRSSWPKMSAGRVRSSTGVCDRWRSVVAMKATWSQPVADVMCLERFASRRTDQFDV